MSEATGQVKAVSTKHSGKVICRPQRGLQDWRAFDCASRTVAVGCANRNSIFAGLSFDLHQTRDEMA